MTTTPDTGLDDVLAPAVDLDLPDLLRSDETTAAPTTEDAEVDPAVVRLADTELLEPDDTNLGIVEVDLLPVDVHDGLDDSFDLDHIGTAYDGPTDSLGFDLDFGAG